VNGRAGRHLTCAVLAALCATACSGADQTSPSAATHGPTAPAAATTPAPSASRSPVPTPFGSVDSNPSDPVIALPTSRTPPPNFRVPPPLENLPAGWNRTVWSAQVQAAVGTHPEPTSQPQPATGWKNWYWSTPGVANLSVGVRLDASGSANELNCAAQGFDPADRSAAADVSALLTLCAKADFPGSAPAAASAWAARQAAPLLAKLRTMTQGQTARSASPTFGAGVYTIEAFYVTGYGNTVEIYVWGPVPK